MAMKRPDLQQSPLLIELAPGFTVRDAIVQDALHGWSLEALCNQYQEQYHLSKAQIVHCIRNV